MLLYDRFRISDAPPEGHPAAAQDVVTQRTLVLFRTSVGSDLLPSRLAEASRIIGDWRPKDASARASTELFSSPGAIWLAAPSEAEVAPLLLEMRAKGLFQEPLRPVPEMPPAPPPPLVSKCTVCGKPSVAGSPYCAACVLLPKDRHVRRSRRWLAGLLGIGLLACLVFVWWNFRPAEPPPPAPMAPIVQFTANRNRVRKGGTVILKWQTTGLTSLSIDHGIGRVGPSGRRSVVVNQDTTFSLLADDHGHQTPVSVTVTVVSPESPKTADVSPPHTGNREPSSTPLFPPGVSSQESPVAAPEQVQAEVRAAVDAWAAAMRSDNPQREAALYAPHIDRYFLQQNVDNAYVLSYLMALQAKGAKFKSFAYSTPTITFAQDGTAQATMLKHFTVELATHESRDVTVRSELRFRRIDGAWKITYERDFRM